jgi:ketosteroid isomerase-like protein
MSKENVEVIRDAFAAFTRGDLAATQAFFHPQAELRSTVGSLEGEVYRGENLMADWVAAFREIWDDFRQEVERVSGKGDAVVAEVRNIGRARGSGVPLADKRYVALLLKDGQIRRVQTFPSRTEALEAVGLSE